MHIQDEDENERLKIERNGALRPPLLVLACASAFHLVREMDGGMRHWFAIFALTKCVGFILAEGATYLGTHWSSRGLLPRLQRFLEEEP